MTWRRHTASDVPQLRGYCRAAHVLCELEALFFSIVYCNVPILNRCLHSQSVIVLLHTKHQNTKCFFSVTIKRKGQCLDLNPNLLTYESFTQSWMRKWLWFSIGDHYTFTFPSFFFSSIDRKQHNHLYERSFFLNYSISQKSFFFVSWVLCENDVLLFI